MYNRKGAALPFAAFAGFAAAQQGYGYGQPPVSSSTYNGICNAAAIARGDCTATAAIVPSSSSTSTFNGICNAAAIARGDCTATAAIVPTPSSYACNPAHDYGNGQTCISTAGSLTLVSATPSATYVCNPAHDYGNGQICISTAGSLTLVSATTSASASVTASCAAPGAYDSKGQYSCNLAHEYPAGKACKMVDGCPVLVDVPTSTSSTTAASATPSCAAPGAYDSKGQYSCNLAHEYPAGKVCKMIDGCPVLVDVPTSTSWTTSAASATPSCAAPGAYDNKGQYSCNLAHEYPAGKICKMVDGCPVLVTVYTTSTSAASATPSCAAPGGYDSKGQYSCNPAHQYPAGQACTYVNGCPVLVTASVGVPESRTQTYACNPAHDYGNGASCISTAGTLSLVYPTASATESKADNSSECYAAYNSCRVKPDSNKSYCASQYAQCLGYNPFNNDGTNTVTPKAGGDTYITTVVTAFTTYCPNPTTFTHGASTYTVTKPTTLTITNCPGGCTVTTPVKSLPPVTVTQVVSSFTTYCPEPTTLTHGGSTYTVTKPTTLTITNCPGGCTIQTTVPAQPPKTTAVAPPPSSQAPPAPSKPVETHPVAPPPSSYAPPAPSSSGLTTYQAPSATRPAPSSASTSPPMYTGAAAPMRSAGAMVAVAAVAAVGAFFL